jgi:hypothetical protein
MSVIGERIRRLPGGAAWLVLFGTDGQVKTLDGKRLRWAWLWVLLWSLGWGIAAAVVYAAAWALFGDPVGDVRLLPALAVTAALSMGPYRTAVRALARSLSPRDATGRAVAAVVLVLTWTAAITMLMLDSYRTSTGLAGWLTFLGPGTKIYLVLSLMPLWGGWATLITPQFCRPGPDDSEPVANFARSCHPLAAALAMAVLLWLTATCFNWMNLGGLAVGMAAVVAAVSSGLALCGGRLSRRALLAANVVTQVVFVLAYVAARNFA